VILIPVYRMSTVTILKITKKVLNSELLSLTSRKEDIGIADSIGNVTSFPV
jgi:hypothetical protein